MPDINCTHCNKIFQPITARQKFCCRNCSIYAWNKTNNYKPKYNPNHKKEYNKKYRELNKEKIQFINQNYYFINKDKIASYNKAYRQNNKQKVRDINKSWKTIHRTKIAKQAKTRYHTDIFFRLRQILRARLKGALINTQKSGSAVADLGCSIFKLKIYLQLKFHRNPRNQHEYMTWDNYGEWHIDHIKPLSKFDLTDPIQFKEACHYTNLQPLWAKDNLSKGNKSESK